MFQKKENSCSVKSVGIIIFISGFGLFFHGLYSLIPVAANILSGIFLFIIGCVIISNEE